MKAVLRAFVLLVPCALACKRDPRAAVHEAPVSGPSVIRRLGEPVEESRLGKVGGSEPVAEPGGPLEATLSGADLYRLGCRACHGPTGSGAPPEILAILGPAGAASADLVASRAAAAGHPIGRELARNLAAEAEQTLRERIVRGGQKMPSFGYLRPDEVGALVVRGTCHVRHDATGPGSRHMTMMSDEIPSLASIRRVYGAREVVRKVRQGRGAMGGMHGRMMRMHASVRMPAFPYLSVAEVEAAYAYLSAVPPIGGD